MWCKNSMDGVLTFNLIMVISRRRIRYGSCCSNLTFSTGQVPVIILFLNKVIMHFFCSCRGCFWPLYQNLIIIQVMLYWYGKFCNQNFQIAFFQEYWLLVQQKIGNLQVHFLNQILNYGNKVNNYMFWTGYPTP